MIFGERDELLENPVFARLDAVAEERVVYLDLTDRFAGALGFGRPLSLPFLLEAEVPKLAAALDGNPSTTKPDPN